MRSQSGSCDRRSYGISRALVPFRYSAFTIIWTATVVSNIGTWMYNAASGWLMTTLDPAPLTIALVQVATALPMFLFALPAGALADIVNNRRLLILVEIVVVVISFVFATLVWLGFITAFWLLVLVLLMAVGEALATPAWQRVLPQLVPNQDMPAAIDMNNVGINISRAIGPALGGVLIGAWGIVAPLWLNALSNLGVIAALILWHPSKTVADSLPAERFTSAMRTGIRHARFNLQLRATIVRTIGFFLFASSYWALLPLIARDQFSGGPSLYGTLLGAIGLGAVGCAFVLPRLKQSFGADCVVAGGTAGTAAALIVYASAHRTGFALAASVLAGASWIAAVSSLNVSAQLALPDWVRGRGLATLATAFFGSMTVGSLAWGAAATSVGVSYTLLTAAFSAVASIPLTWRWKILSGSELDLSPSLHWSAPIVLQKVENDRGPVVVSTEYRVSLDDRDAFLSALKELAAERRRNGAYDWDVYEDIAESDRYLEVFWVDSWLEYLRQHRRVTHSDQILERRVELFHTKGPLKVTHMLGLRRR